MNREQSMNREQFESLRRVLRKLLQGNGKIGDPYGRRWGTNAGIEEAYAELLDVIEGKYGYFALKALTGSLTVQTWYGWTDWQRRVLFTNRRLAMWERSNARRHATVAVQQAQPCRYISVDFLDLPLHPHVHTHATMAATTGQAL